jgi:hypothetical protein
MLLQAPHQPSPHPAAPQDIKDSFLHSLKEFKGSSSSSLPNFLNFWEAPRRLVETSVPIESAEMDAVIVSTAATS